MDASLPPSSPHSLPRPVSLFAPSHPPPPPPRSSGVDETTSEIMVRPFPPLPMELKAEILRFCDPSTLAATSRVSFSFLELSSPILHDHVEIVEFKKLKQLLVSRDRSSFPQLDPFLSRAHISSLTITSPSTVDPHDHSFSQGRLVTHPTPLAVDTLILRINALPHGGNNSPHSHPFWYYIAPHLNSKSIHLVGLPFNPKTHYLPSVDLHNAFFSGLRLLTLTDVMSDASIAQWYCLRLVYTNPREVTVVFKPTRRAGEVKFEENDADMVLYSLWDGGVLEERCRRVSKVIVESSTSEESKSIQRNLEANWTEMGYALEDVERRRSLVSFKVV